MTPTSSNIHTTDPANPLGNIPGHEQPVIAATLAVPKVWTRLVVLCVGLLFALILLVTFMVYINWRTAQANTDRINELNRRLGAIEAQRK